MIMAGGTGGHVMPALAVARYLQEKGVQIHWLGTRAGIEARLVPQAGIPLSFIDIQGLRRNKSISWVFVPWKIAKAILQSYRILAKERPQSVLCMGGYAAGPGAIAAWLLRLPIVLHEQNAIPGVTNKILARFAQRIMVAFPQVFNEFPAKVKVTGNPVRKEILAVQKTYLEGCRILVLGGSLGATKLNEIVPEALSLLPEQKRPQIWHQTGKQHLQGTQAHYAKYKISAQTVEFIDDMAKAYAWADVVICRSGALTIAELAAVGLPSILIPFPYAVDDHQTANAKYLSEKGGAYLLPQATLTAKMLMTVLQELIDNPQKRRYMAMACKDLAKPLATSSVAEFCLEASVNEK